jgi:hypothetical protein
MPDNRRNDYGEFLSPKDVASWVRQEIADADKAHELRVKELAEIAHAYSAGEVTPEQADQLHTRYYERWGDALPSISTGPGVTDEQILKSLDDAAALRKAQIRLKVEGRYR